LKRGCITHSALSQATRSIIFVGHSLGGIVIKQALLIASTNYTYKRDLSLGSIYELTDGVVFMGTPHRGSDKTSWMRMMERIAKVGLKTPNHHLVETLGKESDVLEIQRGEFISISENLTIVSLFEDTPTVVGMVGAHTTISPVIAG
jgi:hypothetical protein